MENGDDLTTLEKLLDRHGMETVLDALATICHEKAESISCNWQDSTTARAWRVAAMKLDHVKISGPISRISRISR